MCFRRMYPYVEVNLEGLDPEDSYVIVLELRQCSECRYRYHGNEWVESGRANPPHGEIDNMFVLSPKKGRDWMQDSCSMYFVKITNNNERIKQKGEEERPVSVLEILNSAFCFLFKNGLFLLLLN